MEVSLKDLLGRGYFPKELPPCFTTRQFAQIVLENPSVQSLPKNKVEFEPIKYGLTLPGPWVRNLMIVHPAAQIWISKAIVDNREEIFSKINIGSLSLSKPTVSKRRALHTERSGAEVAHKRMELQPLGRYYLKCDVAAFYSSIYTHSLAWAMHGKSVAKVERYNKNMAGNLLDFCVQRGTAGQTSGIPVGPDTSLVLAELILAAVDRELVEQVGGLNGFRFMDDYFFVFENRSDAERVLNVLSLCLGEFEIGLNSQKTELDVIPAEIERPWVTELQKAYSNLTSRGGTDCSNYFSTAIDLKRKFPSELVFRYALGQIANGNIDRFRSRDNELLNFIMMAVRSEMGSLRVVFQILVEFFSTTKNSSILLSKLTGRLLLDLEYVSAVLNSHIKWAAAARFDHELIWSLWVLLYFKAAISEDVLRVVVTYPHPLLKILILWGQAESRIVLEGGFESCFVKGDVDKEENWIACYEAKRRDWVDCESDFINDSELFDLLEENEVSFFEPDLSQLVEDDEEDDEEGDRFANY
ncbi:hypothetical protein DV096_15450 [Bradymonadaceae bacterium TMQ3]|nr:hypothetical protein DV096_15450 [Bradymonadaceae bacterium TMQ3]TXC73031.1 RNA-directed DNA polymerase [Bradymonadales bacterium TMQ1]